MKRSLGILLIVALVVPALGVGCNPAAGENGGSIEVQLPTPSPESSPVRGEEGSVQWQPGSTITFRLATPTPTPGEGLILTVPPGLGEEWGIGPIEVIEPPEPGDKVVVMLDREAEAEELIILGQYLELRDYIGDVNSGYVKGCQGVVAILRSLGAPLPPWLCDLYPNIGMVRGILEVEVNTVLSLPFVTGVMVEPSTLAIVFDDLFEAVRLGDVDALTQLHIELGE